MPTKTSPSIPSPPTSPSLVRFQIASRLGGFRDTATIPDPFGTPATFTIHRADSNAHKRWVREEMDRNPMVAEIMIGIESPTLGLNTDDTKTVDGMRAKVETDDTARLLLPIIDRLTFSAIERNLEREATMRALSDGKIHPSDIVNQRADEQLREAMFILKDWANLPADDGSTIPFSAEMRELLLTNDTPLDADNQDISALLLKQECWTYKLPIPDEMADTADGSQEIMTDVSEDGSGVMAPRTVYYKLAVLPSVSTLGRAYLLYFLSASRNRSLFRAQAMEAAAKNSEPSSDSITSSGDGTNETAN